MKKIFVPFLMLFASIISVSVSGENELPSITITPVTYNADSEVQSTGQQVTTASHISTESNFNGSNDQIVPFYIIGSDDRTKVSDTTLNPYNAVVHLKIYFEIAPNTFLVAEGSGFMIDKNTVLTAGHCVYDAEDGKGWASKIDVSPGLDGNTEEFSSHTATSFVTDSKWINDADLNYDWGVITLPENTDAGVGSFGLSTLLPSNDEITTTGYPNDQVNNDMMTTSGEITGTYTYKLRTDLDVVGGQSGSPVYKSNNYVVGIMSHELDLILYKRNVARRLSSSLITYLNDNHIT